MTAAEFRRLALSLPDTEEHSHMNHPDFRVAGKIFATLGYPDASHGMVKLFPDQQAEFTAAHPDAFVPVKGAWGKQGCTQVVLKEADKERVLAAMRAAWERASPKTRTSAAPPVVKRRSPTKKP
jgi:hypothetical protein